MRIDIAVPPFTAAKIVLTRWIAEDGANVHSGASICEFEMASPFGDGIAESTFELESPAAGVLRHLVPAGSVVAIGEGVGWVESEP